MAGGTPPCKSPPSCAAESPCNVRATGRSLKGVLFPRSRLSGLENKELLCMHPQSSMLRPVAAAGVVAATLVLAACGTHGLSAGSIGSGPTGQKLTATRPTVGGADHRTKETP